MQRPPEPTDPEPRNRHERRAAAHHERAAWRVKEWLREVPIGRTKFYQEVKVGRIEVVKAGNATLVTTSPKEYLAALRDERAERCGTCRRRPPDENADARTSRAGGGAIRPIPPRN
jgi:hypothetical protein